MKWKSSQIRIYFLFVECFQKQIYEDFFLFKYKFEYQVGVQVKYVRFIRWFSDSQLLCQWIGHILLAGYIIQETLTDTFIQEYEHWLAFKRMIFLQFPINQWKNISVGTDLNATFGVCRIEASISAWQRARPIDGLISE